jgi:hypothetical protein
LVDRFYYGHAFWQEALDTGAALVFRVKKSLYLPVEQRLPDGSYLSTTRPPKGIAHGHRVRVIEYQLSGSRQVYRLITNILDHTLAPAAELSGVRIPPGVPITKRTVSPRPDFPFFHA